MAKFAQPPYPFGTGKRQAGVSQIEERTVEFKGINRKPYVEDGEMHDMLNLSSDIYPLLGQRKPRGIYTLPEHVVRPVSIIAKYGKIAMIAVDDSDAVNFYFDGTKVNTVIGLSEGTRMVSINTKICFFPEKKYLEITTDGSTVTVGSFGSLEETKTVTSLAVTISNEDARINLGVSHDFAYDDAINLAGSLVYTPSGGTSKTDSVTLACAIEGIDTNTLILPREKFIELTGEGATNVSFTGKIERTMPALEHVIEWNNRLWGANTANNMLFACKLGDPKNWQYYQGTSLDSYYAQIGTDGKWTGSAVYSSHLIFFKQDSMTRIYGTAPSNWQLANTTVFGVEDGSSKSVVTINDRVYYKSVIGIMAYDGGIPYCISSKFNIPFRSVVAGTEGIKYYASIQLEDGGYDLMVLDTEKAVWHKEDHLRMRDTCTIGEKMYIVEYGDPALTVSNSLKASDWLLVRGNNATGQIHVVNPASPSESSDQMNWMAEFGPFDEYVENQKVFSKLALRLNVRKNASVRVYISLDEGEWEMVQRYFAAETGGVFIPIVPRRCDRFSIKIEGTGYCEMKTLTRRVRKGSGNKL